MPTQLFDLTGKEILTGDTIDIGGKTDIVREIHGTFSVFGYTLLYFIERGGVLVV